MCQLLFQNVNYMVTPSFEIRILLLLSTWTVYAEATAKSPSTWFNFLQKNYKWRREGFYWYLLTDMYNVMYCTKLFIGRDLPYKPFMSRSVWYRAQLQWKVKRFIYSGTPVNKGKRGSRESNPILFTPSVTHKHLQSNPLGVQRSGKVGCWSRKSVHGEEKVIKREH